jgi:hypothetical protein
MDEQLKNKFDKWFSGDKKQKLFLTNGEITIFYDDDQIFFYNILLDEDSEITSDYFFSEILKSLDDFLKNQAVIVQEIKNLIGGEN